MTRKIGERVVAIRNATQTTVYLYGRGIYAGDHPVPHWNPDAPAYDDKTWRQVTEEIVRTQIGQPQEEWIVNGIHTGLDQYGNPMGDARTITERVEADLAKIAANPRIDLDTGGSAWGYFCWWGDEERYERTRAGRDEVLVPLPNPMPHSMLTHPAEDVSTA